MTASIKILRIGTKGHHTECHIFIVMSSIPFFVLLSDVKLSVVMLSVLILSDIMLSVVMLNAVTPC
jgi:hypothetical protein